MLSVTLNKLGEVCGLNTVGTGLGVGGGAGGAIALCAPRLLESVHGFAARKVRFHSPKLEFNSASSSTSFVHLSLCTRFPLYPKVGELRAALEHALAHDLQTRAGDCLQCTRYKHPPRDAHKAQHSTTADQDRNWVLVLSSEVLKFVQWRTISVVPSFLHLLHTRTCKFSSLCTVYSYSVYYV